MSTDKGYIKLYRDIRDNFVWDDKPFSKGQAWIDLLMMANHKDKEMLFNGSLIVVKRGSRVTSLHKLAERWGWSSHKVSDFLLILEETGMISHQRDSKKTLINVINYSFYQDAENQKGTVKGQSRNSKGTLKEHSRNTEGTKQRMKKNEEGMKKKEEEIASPSFSETETNNNKFPDDFWSDEGWSK